MRKLDIGQIIIGAIVLLFAVAFVSLAAAGPKSVHSQTEWSNRPEPYTMTYLGRPLHCLVVESEIAGDIGGLSCDFVRFWRGR